MHWSYVENAQGDLAQGDILLPNEPLGAVLGKVHQWFTDPKYLGFLVLTQSCDLVRRNGGGCKTDYITIAAVRPLRQVLISLLRRSCTCLADRYFLASDKNRAIELLHRVINQNEASAGLFYLHQDAEIGIAEESVALLRVSIALRAREHYDTLVSARRGRLNSEFANKLGWLCGNLYSRVGVPDWTETPALEAEADRLVESLLGTPPTSAPVFIDSRKFEKDYKSGKLAVAGASPEQIEAELVKYRGSTFKDIALGAVERVMNAHNMAPDLIAKLKLNIANDQSFTKAIRPGSE